TGTGLGVTAMAADAGGRYFGNQNASQTKPASPVKAKAAGHPNFRMMSATTGGARMAPAAAPLLKMPEARARSRSGNHSDTTLTPADQLPASPVPSRKRNTPRLIGPRANACSSADSDHHPTHRA